MRSWSTQADRPCNFSTTKTTPIKVNPQFKAWVPIVDNPRCILVYTPGVRPIGFVLSTQRLLA